MVAVQRKDYLSRRPELSRIRTDDVLSAVSNAGSSFGWDKVYRARDLGDNPELFLCLSDIDLHLLRFYESEDFVVSQLRPELVYGYLVEEGISLQHIEQGILGRTGHGAGEACGDICQIGKVATVMRRGEKDKTLRRRSDAVIVRRLDPGCDQSLFHKEASHRMRDEYQTPVLLGLLLALEMQTVEEGLGV